MMKIALVGDAFTDEFIYGKEERIAQEGPCPIFDVIDEESRPGGVLNVANNLHGLGLDVTVFTITNLLVSGVKIVTPSRCIPLVKRRYVVRKQYVFRADEPNVYRDCDIRRMEYPNVEDFDMIAFIDYNKGIVRGGKATVVHSKKKNLSVFEGSKYLVLNKKEWEFAQHRTFPIAFVTNGEHGIDAYQDGKFLIRHRVRQVEEVDAIGAGDTVMAVIIYCIAQGVDNPYTIMQFANKAASRVIQKFGTVPVSLRDLEDAL